MKTFDIHEVLATINVEQSISKGCLMHGITDICYKGRLKQNGFKLRRKFILKPIIPGEERTLPDYMTDLVQSINKAQNISKGCLPFKTSSTALRQKLLSLGYKLITSFDLAQI